MKFGKRDLGSKTIVFMSMVFQAVFFIVFAIILEATNSITSWTGTGGNLTTVFPTTSSIVPIIPLIIFVVLEFGALAGAAWGAKKTAEEEKLGTAMILAVIMLAVGLIMFKIILTAAATLLGNTYMSSYTGLKSVVEIAPMLILISYVFESVGTAVYAGYRASKGKK